MLLYNICVLDFRQFIAILWLLSSVLYIFSACIRSHQAKCALLHVYMPFASLVSVYLLHSFINVLRRGQIIALYTFGLLIPSPNAKAGYKGDYSSLVIWEFLPLYGPLSFALPASYQQLSRDLYFFLNFSSAHFSELQNKSKEDVTISFLQMHIQITFHDKQVSL